MELSNGQYVSVFKIDGKPILPPVVCFVNFTFAFCRIAHTQALIGVQLFVVSSVHLLMLQSAENLLCFNLFVQFLVVCSFLFVRFLL